MTLYFRKCGTDDLETLRELSLKTYGDTFGDMTSPANMKDYLEKAYNSIKLREELSDSGSDFYFLYADKILAGYIKLNESKAQTDIHDPQSLEIERIYVIKEFQGKGLGGALMKKAIDIAKSKNKSYVWLGVWERNCNAIVFYKKHGFYATGTHSFFMGEEEQTDFIMRKDL